MSSSKQPSETTTTVKNELPAWAQPYSEGLMAKGAAVAERPYQAYTGNRIAGFSPEQLQGMQGTMTRATQGNAAVNAGQGMLERTLKGDYMSPDSNPWFRQNVDTAMGQVQWRVNNQFNNPGAFGSTAHQEVMNRGLGEIASGMYGQNYANERANQMGAANQALGYGPQDYNDLSAMLRVGDTKRQLQQDYLTSAMDEWANQRNYPLQQLDILGNSLNMAVGG